MRFAKKSGVALQYRYLGGSYQTTMVAGSGGSGGCTRGGKLATANPLPLQQPPF